MRFVIVALAHSARGSDAHRSSLPRLIGALLLAACCLASSAAAQSARQYVNERIAELETLDDVDDFLTEFSTPDTDDVPDEELRRLPGDMRQQLATARQFSNAIEKANSDRRERDYARRIETSLAYARSRAPSYAGPVLALASCYKYRDLGREQFTWGYSERALESYRKARRECRRLKSVPRSLDIALDVSEGTVLLHLRRVPEAQVVLKRAYDMVVEGDYRDTDVASSILGVYGQLLDRQGDKEGGKRILIAAWGRISERRAPALETSIHLALAEDALRRGAPAEALRWAEGAVALLSQLPAKNDMIYRTYFALATAQASLLGLQGAVDSYGLLADYIAKEYPTSDMRPRIMVSYGWALQYSGREAEARQQMVLAEQITREMKTTPAWRSAHYRSLANFYNAARDCPAHLRTAQLTYDFSKERGSDPDLEMNARYALVSALSQCGQAANGLKLLDALAERERDPSSAFATTRQWYRALALEQMGRTDDALAVLKPSCDRFAADTLASFRGDGPKDQSTAYLLQSQTGCEFDLAGLYWKSARGAGQPATGPGHALTGPLGQSFLAAQLSTQQEADDGISLALAIGAARKFGGEVAKTVERFEMARRKLADLQRAYEDVNVVGTLDLLDIGGQLATQRKELEAARAEINLKAADYWRARIPQAVDPAAVQKVLRDGEVAIFVSVGWSASMPNLVFAISKERSDVAAIPVRQEAIYKLVKAHREQIQGARKDETTDETSQSFDLRPGSQLYQTLFSDARIAAILRPATSVAFVPSGDLRDIPLGTLVTRAPAGDGIARGQHELAAAPWLIKEKAVSVFPTLSALVQLRTSQQATTFDADRLLGIADPDFGTGAAPTGKRTAQGEASRRSGALASRIGYPLLWNLDPLGKREIGDIAASFNPAKTDLVDGARANEVWFKNLASSGKLGNYQVIAFATHGLLPSESGTVGEPALALARPNGGNEDGLLTASEVAWMQFSADLVILSSCNSGSPAAGRSLSGMSRAFLQAGARGLILTHWQIRNDVGGEMLPSMFRRYRSGVSPTMAIALQQAAIDLMKRPDIGGAHPYLWASFTLMGDGGPVSRR